MSSSNQNPFLDTVASHRISGISEESYHDDLRPISRSSDPDAISPIETHEPAHPGLDSLLLDETVLAESNNRTTTPGPRSRPARAVKAAALPILRYHRRSLCLLGCYIPFLVVSWALTCVMAVRPLNIPSYYNQIFTSPGLEILRPAKTLAATIIISSLIFLQLVGLAVLGWYIYTVPTWTAALNSLAVVRLAKSIRDDELPPIGPVSDKDLEKLRKIDGLVGVMDDESPTVAVVDATAVGALAVEEHEPKPNDGLIEIHSTRPASAQHDAAVTDSAVTSSSFKLALGPQGWISKRHAPPKKKEKHKQRKTRKGGGSAPEIEGLRVEEV